MLSLSLKALKGLKIKFKYRGLKKWISKFGVENFKIQKLRVVNIYGLKFRVKILGLKNLAKVLCCVLRSERDPFVPTRISAVVSDY